MKMIYDALLARYKRVRLYEKSAAINTSNVPFTGSHSPPVLFIPSIFAVFKLDLLHFGLGLVVLLLLTSSLHHCPSLATNSTF